jgi:hypothetical protein
MRIREVRARHAACSGGLPMKTFLLTTALLAALATPALADAPEDSITLEVEVIESSKKSSQTATFTFTVAAEGACAEASSETPELRYQIEVCRRRGAASAPVLAFEVVRVEYGKTTAVTNKVKVSSKLAPGKRAVVGKITRGDDATEIAATVRQ